MSSEREIGIALLRRLLAGERGSLPMHLALLLERASPLHNSDNHYREILPEEMADIRLSPDTAEEIIGSLCAELTCNPDWAFIAALSTTGSERVTEAVAALLVDPPRPLTIPEFGQALGIVSAFLPIYMARDRQFLPEEKLSRLLELLKESRGYAITIERNTSQLLKTLSGPGS